jgi:hypothetical protein
MLPLKAEIFWRKGRETLSDAGKIQNSSEGLFVYTWCTQKSCQYNILVLSHTTPLTSTLRAHCFRHNVHHRARGEHFCEFSVEIFALIVLFSFKRSSHSTALWPMGKLTGCPGSFRTGSGFEQVWIRIPTIIKKRLKSL